MAVLFYKDPTTNALVEVTEANPLPVTVLEGSDPATSLGKAEDAAHTSGDIGVMMLGVRNDTQTPLSSTNGDYSPIMVSSRGELFATLVKSTLPVLTLHRTISANTTNATNVKASQGNVYSIQAVNINAAARYLKLYNKATAPTVGTDTPVMTIILPPSTPVNITTSMGFGFSLGIGFALTTGIADSDTAAVAANEIVVNLGYA